MRESIANSDKNLIGTPRAVVKCKHTTMYDPNHLNKFIKESDFGNSPSKSSVVANFPQNYYSFNKNSHLSFKA